ncbi:MAG: iron-containing alcohol dehydrogenase [Bacilli bacterium]
MNNFVYYNPTKIYFGEGQIENLTSSIKPYGEKVLVVYGGGSIKKSGLYDEVMNRLKADDFGVWELPGIEPNPRLTTINKGIELCKKEGIDFVLAVGGGSVIDASKAIVVGAKYDGDVWDFYLRKLEVTEGIPLGTILTLAATGSEMNAGSVVTRWETNEKKSAGGDAMRPKFSILDPKYTYSVPEDQSVYGIVDMMSHVFEQYFSHTTATPLQDRFCESVLQTIIEYGPRVLENPEDNDARAIIMQCGTFALNGMISMGMQGDWASHGIEHEVSAIYDIPHGGGLAILFPNWMKHVMDERVEKFKQYAIRVWNVDPSGKSDKEIALAGIEATRSFFDSISAPKTLQHYNIGSDRIAEMAHKAMRDGESIGFFKQLTEEDIRAILTMSI